MGIKIAKITDSYPIANYTNHNWSYLNKTSEEILNEIISRHNTYNAFILIPYNDYGSHVCGYFIIGFRTYGSQALMIDKDMFSNIGQTGMGIDVYARDAGDDVSLVLNDGVFYNGDSITPIEQTINNVVYRCFYSNYTSDTINDCIIYLPNTITNIFIDEWKPISSVRNIHGVCNFSQIPTNRMLATSALESDFDVLLNESKVNIMMEESFIIEDKILIKYSIPLANYNYIKLVYKKDAIPDSADDGTAIIITQNSTSQEITGINQNGVYWFVIFTDKSTSDPKSFKVTGF